MDTRYIIFNNNLMKWISFGNFGIRVVYIFSVFY